MRLACCRVALLALALGVTRCADHPAAPGGTASPVVTEGMSGEDCAAKLSPDASSIYRVAAPDMHHDTDLPSLLREKVMAMVMGGELRRSVARPAAVQAATGLQLLR